MIRSVEATIVLTESPCCFQVGKSSWSPWPGKAPIRASKREEAGDAGAWEAAVSARGEKPWKKCTIKGYRMQQLVVLLLLLLDLPVMGTELFSSSIMILRFITWSCFRVWGLYCSRISRIFLSFQNVEGNSRLVLDSVLSSMCIWFSMLRIERGNQKNQNWKLLYIDERGVE